MLLVDADDDAVPLRSGVEAAAAKPPRCRGVPGAIDCSCGTWSAPSAPNETGAVKLVADTPPSGEVWLLLLLLVVPLPSDINSVRFGGWFDMIVCAAAPF